MIRQRLLVVAVLATTTLPVPAQQPGSARVERQIRTAAAGPHKLRVDVPLLTSGQRFRTVVVEGDGTQARDGLADLRLFEPDGTEIPYLFISPPAHRHPWIAGSVLGVTPTKTTSGFEIDLRDAAMVDALLIEGLPAPFMKRFRLEGSGDRTRWTVLVAEGTIFDLPGERVRQLSAAFEAGAYQYLRVTWDDRHSAPVPLPRTVRARQAARQTAAEPLSAPLQVEPQASEPGRSRYRLRLPGSGLPIAALVLNARGGDVFRTAIVTESRFSGARAEPAELGRARIVRSAAAGGSALAPLRIPTEPPRGPELQLVIENGDNAPLPLDGVLAEFAQLPWIYFEASGRRTVARYGDPSAAAPQYDLEARRRAIRLDDVPEAAWEEPRALGGEVRPSAPEAVPAQGARLEIAGFRYRRALPEAQEGLVSLQLDAAVLAHSRGPHGGFADIRLVDGAGYQIPYVLERRDEPLAVDLQLRAAPADPELPGERAANRSVYVLPLPYPDLPVDRLVIETSERVFRRPLQVAVQRPPDRQHRDTWLDVLASTTWQHADRESPAVPLELPVRPRDAAEMLLIVDEGDNRPLPVIAARLLLPSWRLRFFKPGSPVSLLYRHDSISAPQYDLALLAPVVMGFPARDVAAAPEEELAASRRTALPPAVFWVGLGLATIVILGLLVRLIASGTPGAPHA